MADRECRAETKEVEGPAYVIDTLGERDIFCPTNSGEKLRFLDDSTVKKGDPEPVNARRLAQVVEGARRFEWQYRAAMAFRERRHQQGWWVTLTYSETELPATWETARRDIALWTKRLRKFIRKHTKETMQYLIVEEEGELRGRKHFHALVWLPVDLELQFRTDKKLWVDTPLLKWHHGFMDVKKLDVSRQQGLAIYVAKYAKKHNGRTKCNYSFGLNPATMLLSLASFRMLFLMAPRMAQNLLRRLSLTPNYLSLRTMTSLLSSETLPTTFQDRSALQKIRATGTRISSVKQLRKIISEGSDALTGSPDLASKVSTALCFALVKDCVKQLRSDSFRSLQPDAEVYFPGARLFGTPRPVSDAARLEPDRRTAIFFVRSKHPRCATRRARNNSVRMG